MGEAEEVRSGLRDGTPRVMGVADPEDQFDRRAAGPVVELDPAEDARRKGGPLRRPRPPGGIGSVVPRGRETEGERAACPDVGGPTQFPRELLRAEGATRRRNVGAGFAGERLGTPLGTSVEERQQAPRGFVGRTVTDEDVLVRRPRQRLSEAPAGAVATDREAREGAERRVLGVVGRGRRHGGSRSDGQGS